MYFFEKEELGAMLTAGVWDGSTDTDRPWPSENRANGREGGEGMFAIEQLAEDRRLVSARDGFYLLHDNPASSILSVL